MFADNGAWRGWRVVTAIDLALLVVSGIWLVFRFHPVMPWAPTTDPVRVVHTVTAFVLVLLLAVAFLVAAARAASELAGHIVPLVASIVALMAAAAGIVTGRMLPWDQVALWAVTVGTNVSGYGVLWDDNSRFFLAQGTEVSVDQMRTVFLVHVVAVPLVLAVVGGLVLARRRRDPLAEPDPAARRLIS